MEVVPVSVGRAARAWDEQHLDLAAAGRQLAAASSAGFTAGVAGAASRFASTWRRHTEALAAQAEASADGLRRVMADYVSTDRSTGGQLLVLQSHLREHR